MTGQYMVTITAPDGTPVFTGPASSFTLTKRSADQVAHVQFNEPIVGTCPPPKPPLWWQFTPNPNVVDCLWRSEQ